VEAGDILPLCAQLDVRPGTVEPEIIKGRPGNPEPMPYGLLAELTYRCPLRCPYCSNPVALGTTELDTETWMRVLDEARALGVLQLHLSGGEPLARKDLAVLVRHARALGLYTNLVTSGIGLSAPRFDELVAAGLDHVQLSLQDSEPAEADAIAGIAAHQRKLAVAKLVTGAGLPLSINVVLHRHNVSRLAEIAELAVGLGAERVELAHTQYYGWGLLNRDALLPDREQVARADAAAAGIVAAHPDVELVYVRPDYYDGVPKPCMNGWASTQLVVDPSGQVLPCPAATVIPDLARLSVRAHSLSFIWYESEPFNRFRGTSWMRDPCRSCPRREVDFGGCRCQAFQLTGDAAETDPACHLSPRHATVTAAIASAAPIPFTPRRV
jgi:pyrroloquinoline quinone biosynthesis protein E